MSHPPGPPDDAEPGAEGTDPGYAGQQPGYGGPPGYGAEPGYGQGYPPGYGGYGPGQPTTNGKATAALVTGITTLVLSWCCGLGVVGVVAIVLGVKARNEIGYSGGAQTGDGMALAGIITGAVAVVVGVLALVAVILAIASGTAEYGIDRNGTGF